MPRLFTSRTRWIVPPAIAAVTAAAVILPQAASGAVHPDLPTQTAAQVLADLSQANTPEFSGTVVATSNLGLPSLPSSSAAGSSGAQLQQVETLLTGSHTLKIAYGGPDKQRVAVILTDLSESDVVHDGTNLWTYSSQDNAVTHTTLAAGSAHKDATTTAPAGLGLTPQAAAQQALSEISPSTTVSVDKTAMVAGRPAYQLVLSPKDPASLVGSVRIAMDSATHLPLRTQIYSTSNGTTPAFQVGFTSLTLANPSSSTFAFSTPPGATVTTLGEPATHVSGSHHDAEPSGVTTSGSGWGTVLAGKLPADLSGTAGGKHSVSGELNDILTPVAGGRAVNTALVSVLLTDDGRYLVGAVTPARLQQLAAQGLGKVTDLVIETHGLTKRFHSGQVAVAGIDLAVPRGAVYGFLGPNGSGKTTTIRMLLGLVQPTAGEITVLDHRVPGEVADALPRVGAMIEGPAFHPYLAGRINLVRLDAMSATADPSTRDQRVDAALGRVGLSNAAGKKFRQYSLGMKQRLGIAAALLEPRDLLVLDEPTNGLDPQGTREVRSLVRELAADGTSVFVSSHLLAEISQVCTHVGIMSRGSLVLQASLPELRAAGEATVAVTTADPDKAAIVLRDLGLQAVNAGLSEATALLGAVRAEDVTVALVEAGVGVSGLAVRRRDLEDVFVELTGEGFDVAR